METVLIGYSYKLINSSASSPPSPRCSSRSLLASASSPPSLRPKVGATPWPSHSAAAAY